MEKIRTDGSKIVTIPFVFSTLYISERLILDFKVSNSKTSCIASKLLVLNGRFSQSEF